MDRPSVGGCVERARPDWNDRYERRVFTFFSLLIRLSCHFKSVYPVNNDLHWVRWGFRTVPLQLGCAIGRTNEEKKNKLSDVQSRI